MLLAHVTLLLSATESDATAADGRQAVADLGKCLEIYDGALPAILSLWRADQSQRLGDLVQPSTLHLCWALGWRAWYLSWCLLEDRESWTGQRMRLADAPGAVLSAPGRLDALQERWPVVRRMVRRGLPAEDEDVLGAALHNETTAMLRMPLPSAETPGPILSIKEQQFTAAISFSPYTWRERELPDDELAAQLDAGGAKPRPPETADPIEWTPATTIKEFANDMGVHRNTLAKRIKDGTVPHQRFGKLFQIDIRALPPARQAKYRPKG